MGKLPEEPSCSASSCHIGREDGILLTIDDALSDPEGLVSAAQDEIYVRAGAVYPGIRAPVPASYIRQFEQRIKPVIESVFGYSLRKGIEGCSYSIVTIAPHLLAANQRTPHTDENDPLSLAFIHYLCSPDHGGTSFFRHRETGYERIGPERALRYNAAVARDLAEREKFSESQFVVDSDAHFERILTAENRFNRMLVYPGNNLHSGDIRRPMALSPHPGKGRLTVTGFLRLEVS